MCDEESCTICLDQLFQPFKTDVITRLQPCGHYYHSECIVIWAEKSNSCPTCRRDFEMVETINKSGEVLTAKRAQKKVIEHVEEFFHSNDDVLMTYDEDDFLERRISNMIARSNICILCDSRNGNVTPCNTCSSTFHLSCLGATNLSRWFCPMCDAEQINLERPVSVFRRSRNSAVTNRVYDSFRSSLLTNPVTVEVKENPKPMTMEEHQSWEIFEEAKKDREDGQHDEPVLVPTGEGINGGSSVKKFKQPSRRGRRSGIKKTTPPSFIPTATPSSSKSLVETIVDQMKENRSKEKLQFTSLTPVRAETISSATPLSPSSSPSSSSGSSPQPTMSSLSTSPEREPIPTTTSNKSIWKMSIPSNTLTLSQKSTLQEIVRNRLRPIFKDGTIDVEQYTTINKKVSHILYETCLNENCTEDFDFDQLADFHVTQEIMEL